MNIKAVERIKAMEVILDTAIQKADNLEMAIRELEEYQEEIQKLEAYYTSDDWKDDYKLDEVGGLPADLKRGVLSEDGIYNMLVRNKELLKKVCK